MLQIQAMLVPFTKEMPGMDDPELADDDEGDDSDWDDNENGKDNEVEAGREDFDDETCEEAMNEVNDTFVVSTEQTKVARSSLTKVRIHMLVVYLHALTNSPTAKATCEEPSPFTHRRKRP